MLCYIEEKCYEVRELLEKLQNKLNEIPKYKNNIKRAHRLSNISFLQKDSKVFDGITTQIHTSQPAEKYSLLNNQNSESCKFLTFNFFIDFLTI